MQQTEIESKDSSKVTAIALGNLIAYFLLLCIIVFLIVLLPIPLLFLALLYSAIGIACSWSLSRFTRWSWYAAMIMWVSEGAAFFLPITSVLTNQNSSYLGPTVISVLVVFARFASAYYFSQNKIRRLYLHSANILKTQETKH